MLISRLLPFSLLVAVSAASVAAQSAPQKNPVVVPSTNSADLLSPNLKTELNPAKPLDRVGIEEYPPQLNQLVLPHIFVDPDAQPQGDTLCYAIRSYKVARDDPQSDSTHAAGYSTCQAATRFRMYSIKEAVLHVTP